MKFYIKYNYYIVVLDLCYDIYLQIMKIIICELQSMLDVLWNPIIIFIKQHQNITLTQHSLDIIE